MKNILRENSMLIYIYREFNIYREKYKYSIFIEKNIVGKLLKCHSIIELTY